MRAIQDSLYNWLSIQVVSDARPEDSAAKNTAKMFKGMLETEHEITVTEVIKDETMYYIHYLQQGEEKKMRFPCELIEFMLHQINLEPEKYVNYPIDVEDEAQ